MQLEKELILLIKYHDIWAWKSNKNILNNNNNNNNNEIVLSKISKLEKEIIKVKEDYEKIKKE